MASVDFSAVIPGALGARIDIASGAEVAQLGQSLAPPDLHPQLLPLDKSGESATPLVLRLGGPKLGKIWSVRKIVVTGSDDHTAVASVAGAIYVTGGGPE